MEQTSNTPAWLTASEIELVYKTKVKASQRPLIQTSSDAHKVLLQAWDEGKMEFLEQFNVLLLNRASKVLGIYKASSGGITSTIADARLIFTAALKAGAVALVLSHNHPSGNLKPSKADEDLTKRIKQAGEFLDIKVLDHIIMTSDSYFSFADEGLL